MVKFINNWMFAQHRWKDEESTPVTINIRKIVKITEIRNTQYGDYVAVFTDDEELIPIEGNIIEVLAKFQEHLTNF